MYTTQMTVYQLLDLANTACAYVRAREAPIGPPRFTEDIPLNPWRADQLKAEEIERKYDELRKLVLGE